MIVGWQADFKDTLRPTLRILASYVACNAVNKPSFQNPTKTFCPMVHRCITFMDCWAGFGKDGLLAELQARMSRGCRFFAVFAL